MQALSNYSCWLSSISFRQHSHSRGCSQLQAHPNRREAVQDVMSHHVKDEAPQEELLEQPAAPVDLDVEVSTTLFLPCKPLPNGPAGSICLNLCCLVTCLAAVAAGRKFKTCPPVMLQA